MNEIWKNIIGYENYQVSNLGNIRHINSKNIRKYKISNCGYCVLNLSKNKRIITQLIHRLVANSFIPNIYNKPHINHIDGNKQNNNVSNLEWVTQSENMTHAFKNKLQIPLENELHPNCKLSNDEILSIRSMYKVGNISQSKLGKLFNCSQTNISKIISNKRRNNLK